MKALERIIEQAKAERKRIVLPEGDDPRVLEAAVRAHQDGLAEVVLLGSATTLEETAASIGVSLDGIEQIDPAKSEHRLSYANTLHELRHHKGMSLKQAREQIVNPLVYAALMVKREDADGMVAGAVNTTADVVRSAIQIIGVDKDFKLVSSFFLMMLCEPFHNMKGGKIFSDCALVVDPTTEELSEIAVAAALSCRALLQEEPRVAMLSFSTGGSATHKAVDKVNDAAKLAKDQLPNLKIDGDIQLDAAIMSEISEKKLPNSETQGDANVLVFPNLDAGNIGYKLAERIGKAHAIGPLLQGLAKPANDLSRGCNADDVYYVISVTAVQAQATS